MPEGDTLFRTAEVLRAVLVGRPIAAARGRAGGPRLGMLEGRTVERVEARGKHLLVQTSGGLTLHTHLGMHGSWHRYRTAEPWRRAARDAVAVIEVPGAVAVCFSAPTVELLETRALALHPILSRLGPDLLAAADLPRTPDLTRTPDLPRTPDLRRTSDGAGGGHSGDGVSAVEDSAVEGSAAEDSEVLRRLRDPARATLDIGDALLDQRAVAGIGNVYRSEVCFIERVDPFTPVSALDDPTLARLVRAARRLLRANAHGPFRTTVNVTAEDVTAVGVPAALGARLWVYGRTGRPCRRCGSPVRSRVSGSHARRVYWCPVCQPPVTSVGSADGGGPVVI